MSFRLILLIPLAIVGGMLWALPFIVRRGLLFGVPVPDGFRERPEARRAINEYSLGVGLAILLAAALTVWAPSTTGSTVFVTPLIIVTTAGLLHYRQYRRLAPFAVQPRLSASVNLAATDNRLPGWAWLGVLPFLLLGATALYLNSHWSEIPQRWPRHWGIDGKPNGWGERSIKGVYGPLALGALLIFYMSGVAAATWFGARRRRMRVLTMKILVAVSLLMGAVFTMVGLSPLAQRAPPVWTVLLMVFAPIVLIIGWSIRANQAVDDEPVESTPNECWYGGVIYYNPNDAALFVERREGVGMTVNFGNTWSWVLMAGPMLLFIAIGSLIKP